MSEIKIVGPKILFDIPIFGGIQITETVFYSFMVTFLIFILSIVLTRKLSKIPTKKTQIIAEKFVIIIDKFVETTMGKAKQRYTPYIMTILLSSIFGSLISLLGFRSVTADINTTMTWAIITFIMIQYSGIKSKGVVKHYKGLLEPMPFMLPLNLISELSTPVSMGFRHFGNIMSGMVINTLIYAALSGLTMIIFGISILNLISELSTPVSMGFRHFGNIMSGMVINTLIYAALSGLTMIIFGISIPFLQIGVPAVLSLYFDLFSGFMQAFIFCMLSMVFIANSAE